VPRCEGYSAYGYAKVIRKVPEELALAAPGEKDALHLEKFLLALCHGGKQWEGIQIL
jgi:hypothetical protein